ncbi:MAG: phosphoribosylformylglycinamidine synthase I [Candidatus Subteraquimicrobiales bacterium]|nr:phosphoribosylformylglycinamidine synthase I [Candidatus Subteraquimicrobiales bacterium]
MKKPKVCVLLAAGINRDYDAAYAFEKAGAEAERVHINTLASREKSLKEYQILMLPGGFSFGDDIASGKVLANKLKYKLLDEIIEFISDGKLIFGVCNGFQVMVKLGLLPGFNRDYRNQQTTLTFNDSGKFEDRWVYLKVNPESNCIFTKGLSGLLYVPICHGEGKFVVKNEEVLKNLWANQQVAVEYVDSEGNLAGYPFNPNGSVDNIAGICDETGRVFGMMPHPEDFIEMTHHPRWTRKEVSKDGAGLALFKNAIEYIQREFAN